MKEMKHLSARKHFGADKIKAGDFLPLVSQNYPLKLSELSRNDCWLHHLSEAFGVLALAFLFMATNKLKLGVPAIAGMPPTPLFPIASTPVLQKGCQDITRGHPGLQTVLPGHKT